MGSVSSEQGAQAGAETNKHPLPLEIPVVAAGARPGDHAEKRELFTEETETVLVFEHGAVIHLAAAVAVGQLVFLTNKQTGKEIVTQVLRKRSYRPTACYVELDFTEAAPGFWGVEFPTADAAAKANLPESGEAAQVAEAEITEEEFGPTAPPDQAEVTRLRREVEALKSQLKSLATPSEQLAAKHLSEMQQPSASELENLKSLLGSKKSAEEPEEEAKPGRNGVENAPAKLEIMSPHEPKPEPVKSEGAGQEEGRAAPDGEAEKSSSYPIRMQLPKAQGTSNRSSEFAADSAAITAAIDDHLLPKPSLDFEHFPGVRESKPKLYSGKARRSLSGPIGVLVVIVLLLVATGIGAYRLGWFSRSDRMNAETETKASVMPRGPSPSSASPDTAAAKENPPGTAAATAADRANEQPIAKNGGANAESGEPERLASTASEASAAAIKKSESHSNIAASSKKGTVARAGPNDLPPPAAPQEDVYVPPKLLKAIRSLSPPEALRAYVSGVVTLDAVVDENGRVTSATPMSGPKALHKKAEDTVKDYVYQPATKNGKPVPAHVEVKIQFWYEP